MAMILEYEMNVNMFKIISNLKSVYHESEHSTVAAMIQSKNTHDTNFMDVQVSCHKLGHSILKSN